MRGSPEGNGRALDLGSRLLLTMRADGLGLFRGCGVGEEGGGCNVGRGMYLCIPENLFIFFVHEKDGADVGL